MNIIKALQWRYATKKFDQTKKIPEQDFQELLDVARFAPSSYGFEPWKFIVVKNPAVRAKLREASWNQTQITDASHMIVFSARTDLDAAYVKQFVKRTAEARKMPVEALKTYEDMMLGDINNRSKEAIVDWNKRQVYLALGMFLEAAALKGIDACPMEGFDPKAYDNILNLSAENTTATVVCTLGYRATDDATAGYAKVRFAKKDVVVEK